MAVGVGGGGSGVGRAAVAATAPKGAARSQARLPPPPQSEGRLVFARSHESWILLNLSGCEAVMNNTAVIFTI